MNASSSFFWSWAAIAWLPLFMVSVVVSTLLYRQKRGLLLAAALALTAGCYLMFQIAILSAWDGVSFNAAETSLSWILSRPVSVHIGLYAAAVLGLAGLILAVRRRDRNRITPMSVKEAVDSLPTGVCIWLPGGQTIMTNRTMERFCRAATGEAPINGERVCRQLRDGSLQDGCERIMAGDMPVILLADGTVWSVSVSDESFRSTPVRRLLVSEITETYRKTQSLQEMQQSLAALNERLTAYNREIVALTAEKELLNARVRMHDQMGEDLLTMKRYLRESGTEEDRQGIEAMLRRNITFLKTGFNPVRRDEYEVLAETAEKLGVHISVTGELPQAEPWKHIAVTGLHECFTNTLRHARGDRLDVDAEKTENGLRISCTNNGIPPSGPISEKGGLAALRGLAEQAGGRMSISVDPVFRLTLELPGEVHHAVQSIDR